MKSQAIPSHPADARQRAARLDAFLEAWDGNPRLLQISYFPLRDNRPFDHYQAFCDAFEQNLTPVFCTNTADLYRLAALLLGEALVAHLDYAWCRSGVFPDEPLQVMRDGAHPHVLHLPGMIANVIAQIDETELPLLLDRICDEYLPDADLYHWLLALNHPKYDEAAYRARFGITLNANRRSRVRQLLACNTAAILYNSTLQPPLVAMGKKGWYAVDRFLNRMEKQFARDYGEDWRNMTVNPEELR